MRDIKKYYENTKNALPHENIKEFIKMKAKSGKAIDLGCGTGRDTVFLIKNTWDVLAIDREEDAKEIILEKLNTEELKRFRFISENFENIELEKNNLIVANFSLPFCNKNYFYELWNKIVTSISKDGYFVGNLFGLNDAWATERGNMTFLSKQQVLELLNLFEIVKFKEFERDGKTGIGEMKHWHIYDIIARKK